jgi:hypothetical protein
MSSSSGLSADVVQSFGIEVRGLVDRARRLSTRFTHKVHCHKLLTVSPTKAMISTNHHPHIFYINFFSYNPPTPQLSSFSALSSAIFYTNTKMPFSSFLLQCCKGSKRSKRSAAVEFNDLPPVRLISFETMPLRITSFLPTSPRPVPQLNVSASSSTSVAMFDHMSNTSMKTLTNSFTTHDTFEDVDLATPTVFADPPKQRKTINASLFDDQHEVDNNLAVSSSLNNDDKGSYPSRTSDTPFVLAKQSAWVAFPFGDEHGLESEPEVEYAPATPSSVHDYTERAMEYQRGKFCPSSTSPKP